VDRFLQGPLVKSLGLGAFRQVPSLLEGSRVGWKQRRRPKVGQLFHLLDPPFFVLSWLARSIKSRLGLFLYTKLQQFEKKKEIAGNGNQSSGRLASFCDRSLLSEVAFGRGR